MEQHKSVLEFKNYIVEKMLYEYNDNFDPVDNEELHMEFDITATIFSNREDDFVKLIAEIGNKEDKQCPFTITVVITGVYKFNGAEIDEKDNFLSSSAIAVLFPYLRSIVSDLSGKSNIFPQFKLPLINIISYLKDEDRITFLGNN